MALTHESTIKRLGFKPGDIKIAHYDIAFTAHQLVEPSNDPGWYLLNGSILSQTGFPVLFARFGTTFNTGGEGAGNFRLPDYTEGYTPIAKGLSAFTAFGTKGGEVNHTLLNSEMPSHTHTDSGHVHGYPGLNSGSSVNSGGGNVTLKNATLFTNSATAVLDSVGGGGTHNNMQPYIVVGGFLVMYG